MRYNQSKKCFITTFCASVWLIYVCVFFHALTSLFLAQNDCHLSGSCMAFPPSGFFHAVTGRSQARGFLLLHCEHLYGFSSGGFFHALPGCFQLEILITLWAAIWLYKWVLSCFNRSLSSSKYFITLWAAVWFFIVRLVVSSHSSWWHFVLLILLLQLWHLKGRNSTVVCLGMSNYFLWL